MPSSVYCRRCRATIIVPTQAQRQRLVDLVKYTANTNSVEMMKVLEREGMSLRDAKAVVLHLTRGGTCRRCRAAIPEVAVHTCDCGTVNVDLALNR